MTHDPPQASPYIVTAAAPEGIVQQTRVVVGSAMALAFKWRTAGYADVKVRDPSGKSLSLEAYRERIMRGRHRFD